MPASIAALGWPLRASLQTASGLALVAVLWPGRREAEIDVGFDHIPHAHYVRHPSWKRFLAARSKGCLILLTTKADAPYHAFEFRPDGTLLLGHEWAERPSTCTAPPTRASRRR